MEISRDRRHEPDLNARHGKPHASLVPQKRVRRTSPTWPISCAGTWLFPNSYISGLTRWQIIPVFKKGGKDTFFQPLRCNSSVIFFETSSIPSTCFDFFVWYLQRLVDCRTKLVADALSGNGILQCSVGQDLLACSDYTGRPLNPKA